MSQIESADVPWSEAVIMVCTKCSRKIIGDVPPFPSGVSSHLGLMRAFPRSADSLRGRVISKSASGRCGFCSTPFC